MATTEESLATLEAKMAALETKLAALTDTTPTTYYTHQYSGEEIDAAVGRAVAGGTLDTSVTNIGNQLGTFVRPNLLDNWYFGNPINQRGQTEYTGNGYTVDRWMIGAGSNGTLSLADSGLKLSRTDGPMYLAHRILKTQIPEGSVLTYSVLTSYGLFSTSFVVKNDTYHEQVVGGGISLGWNYTPAGMVEFTLVNNTVNSDVTVLAAKLELGPTQTLAHREGDRWVLNEIPDYGEQLRRCQRYARSLRGNSKSAYCQLATGVATSSTKATLYVPLAQPLRTGPAITSTGNFRIVARGGQVITVTGFDFNLSEWSGSIVRFGVSVAGGLTAGDFVVLQPNNGASADILLSADL